MDSFLSYLSENPHALGIANLVAVCTAAYFSAKFLIALVKFGFRIVKEGLIPALDDFEVHHKKRVEIAKNSSSFLIAYVSRSSMLMLICVVNIIVVTSSSAEYLPEKVPQTIALISILIILMSGSRIMRVCRDVMEAQESEVYADGGKSDNTV